MNKVREWVVSPAVSHARKAPLTLIFVVFMWAVFVVSKLSRVDTVEALGLRIHSHILSLRIFSSGFTTSTLRGLLACTVALLVAGVIAERTLGIKRYGLLALLSQLVAVPVGYVLGRWLVQETDSTSVMSAAHFLSPVAWIVGPLAAATAVMPTLWQRRIRTLLVVSGVSLALYSGSILDFVYLSAVILGIIMGQLTSDSNGLGGVPAGHAAMKSMKGLSLREKRVLVALIIAAVVVSPLVSLINPHAAGPFSQLTNLVWQPALSKAEVAAVCSSQGSGVQSEACIQALQFNRNNGFGPFMANAMPFVVQLLALIGLSRGRRINYWLTLVFTISTAVLMVMETFAFQVSENPVADSVNVAMTILPWVAITVLLLCTRKWFFVATKKETVRRSLSITLIAAVGASALWIVGAWLLHSHFSPQLDWALIVDEWPMRFVPPPVAMSAPVLFQPLDAPAWLVFEWPGTIFWIVVSIVLVQLLGARHSTEDARAHEKARTLLTSGTGDHLSAMTLWRGNTYWFDGNNYVAYRVKNNVALTLGGPITEINSLRARVKVAQDFEDFAVSQGLSTAWYSVDEDFATALSTNGFKRLQVAEESILDTANTEFKGKKFQNVRTARNRAVKEGIVAQWTTWADASPQLREHIIELSEEWVSDKALPEMGFTLGSIEEMKEPDTRILVAVNEADELQGVTSWLPRYEDGHCTGLVLDVMRRNSAGFRPVIEFLISEAMLKAHEESIAWISLSGAPLSRSDDGPRTLLDNVLDKVGEYMEPLYGFRSLAASKDKFQPEHHAWYLCYRDELSLPAIGLAVCASYVPEIKAKDGIEAAKALLASRKSQNEH